MKIVLIYLLLISLLGMSLQCEAADGEEKVSQTIMLRFDLSFNRKINISVTADTFPHFLALKQTFDVYGMEHYECCDNGIEAARLIETERSAETNRKKNNTVFFKFFAVDPSTLGDQGWGPKLYMGHQHDLLFQEASTDPASNPQLSYYKGHFYKQLGLHFYKNDDFDHAQKYYQRGVHYGNADCNYWLEAVMLRRSEVEAKPYIEAIAAGNKMAYLDLIDVYTRHRLFDQAIQEVKEIVYQGRCIEETLVLTSLSRVILVDLYIQKGDFIQAHETFKKITDEKLRNKTYKLFVEPNDLAALVFNEIK